MLYKLIVAEGDPIMLNFDFYFRHSYPFHGQQNCARALALTPQGNILASGDDDMRILLWDTFSLSNKPCKSIPTSHDGDKQWRLTVKDSASIVQVHPVASYFTTANW